LITKCIVRDPAQTVQQQLRHIEDYALERLNSTMYEDFLLVKLFSTKRETVLQKIETNLKSTTEKIFMNLVSQCVENDPDVTGQILINFRRGKVGSDFIDCPSPGVDSLFGFR
jgi:hypothetical protein